MVTRRAILTMVAVMVLATLFGAIGLAQPDSPPTKVNTTLLAPGSEYVNYQGVLTDGAGTPLANGDYTVTFALYDEAEADEPVWTETQTVFTTKGLFNVPLGTVTPLDPETTDGRDLWLGVKVGDDAEMTPRLPISSVFYARSLVPGAYLYGNLPNAAILSIYNDTFGNDGIGLRVESRRDNAIEARGDVEVQRGDVDVVQGNVEAGQNVTAGQDVIAGDDVLAGRDIRAERHLTARADVAAEGTVFAGNNIQADNDVLAGRHVEANGNVSANGGNVFGQNVLSNALVRAGSDVEAERDVKADNNVRAENDVIANRQVVANLNIQTTNGSLLGQNVIVSGVVRTTGGNVEADGNVTADGDVIAGGDLIAGGTKPALVQTESFGRRFTYAIEGTQVWFVDQGRGQLEKGVATIHLDPIFLETVTIDEQHPMLVHITLTSDSQGVYVARQTSNSFTVRELQGGTSDATFNWQVNALRKGYEDTRLEVYEESE